MNQHSTCSPSDAQSEALHEMHLVLSGDEIAAIEGWRAANDLSTASEAIRELVKLGLLSELSKVYEVVSAVRGSIGR